MARAKAISLVSKKPVKNAVHASTYKGKDIDVTTYILKDGFKSVGTHCITYMSPQAKDIIAKGGKVDINSFDLDDTLVKTKSGVKFARTADDWKWWNDIVPLKLKEWINSKPNERLIVIFTNQGGVTNNQQPAKPSVSFEKLLGRLHLILTELSPLPVLLYAATKKSAADTKLNKGSPAELHKHYRKPGIGMWEHMVQDLGASVNTGSLLYVGDAAGRKNDFSNSDKEFAAAAGVQFMTPEKYFEP